MDDYNKRMTILVWTSDQPPKLIHKDLIGIVASFT